MKRPYLFIAVGLLMATMFLANAQQLGGGFSGPRTVITVEQAKTLQDDAPVILQGKIQRSIGKDRYLFADNTGNVTVEIEQKVWRGLTVDQNDNVEISGEVERGWNKFEIEVKSIRKL